MSRISLIFCLFFLHLSPLIAQDLDSLTAAQLNSKGFDLYNEKKYEESLVYFKASFEKNPDYSFPHYNYACVLSILKRDREAVAQHLLIAFFFNPRFREKYFTDPDLDWFRSQPDAGPYRFSLYRLDVKAETVKKILLGGGRDRSYDVYDPAASSYGGGYMTLRANGSVRVWNGVDDVNGKYRIQGSLVYIELEWPVDLGSANTPSPVGRMILSIQADGERMVLAEGFIIGRNEARPLSVGVHIDGGV